MPGTFATYETTSTLYKSQLYNATMHKFHKIIYKILLNRDFKIKNLLSPSSGLKPLTLQMVSSCLGMHFLRYSDLHLSNCSFCLEQ